MLHRREFRIYIIAIAIVLLTGCSLLLKPQLPPVSSVHLRLGNPSQASDRDPNNYLIVKPQYALSYNKDKGIPNWVSWQLNTSWLGSVPRSNNFRPDDTLPEDWYRVTPTDYIRSGYDKGHMIPSGDRTNNVENNASTFLMTNIVPQAADNNQGYWADLENYCRDVVKNGQELYIIAGGYGTQGNIGRGKVAIPARLYKIIVAAVPGKGIEGIDKTSLVIAIDTPNIDGNRQADWSQFLTTIDELERNTGYDFLSNIKPDIQKFIEAKR